MATQGNGARVLGPWPIDYFNSGALLFHGLVGQANHSLVEKHSTGIFLCPTRLRENAPQGPFLIPQGDRNFNYGCGALFSHAEIREDMIYDIILNTLTGQFSKALNRALDIIYHGIGRKTGF